MASPHQGPSPRSLPRASRGTGSFSPRRSYARARASRERIGLMDRMEKNKQSQAKFSRGVRLTVNIICAIGIIVLLVYTFFLAPKPDIDADGGVRADLYVK